MCVGIMKIIQAHINVRLGGILYRKQIVGHRDRWKQDHEQQDQSDYLHPPVVIAVRNSAQPEAHHRNGDQYSGEIEE